MWKVDKLKIKLAVLSFRRSQDVRRRHIVNDVMTRARLRDRAHSELAVICRSQSDLSGRRRRTVY